MKLHTVLIAATLLIACAVVHGFPFQEDKQLNLAADGIKTVEIDCGSGYLKIKGVEGLEQIEVEATLVVKGIDEDDIERFKKRHVKLSLEKKGTSAVLISKIDYSAISTLFKPRSAHINLDVRIPKNLELVIDDGSGSIEVADIANNVKLDDGSGSIEMDHIKGNVFIDDGSGSIELTTIGGNVEIDDGSGTITVEEASGDVDVKDGSGTIKISKIGGSVVVSDGSGGIYIDGVDKDVNIKRDGSGSVSIQNVKGKVRKK
ncbi:MAG: hypothetical protein GTO45_12840 [Candidatus Aminicenantes bacterium]|nr:hypothetical protein [Candidatus Aminicenantes bacterium]NIM79671.1 hypothetical protein [Candidatus Aminicenantes bacterium]NIN18997.1 hypothetical protein [Candidatus Aminicenantes bacterium]NIN42899.1 hypothetical protein [Candidatus Aminicenantes bacterium]NIN85636.1 hypothetical protein [Candidatus Aminicenantes bacterium]